MNTTRRERSTQPLSRLLAAEVLHGQDVGVLDEPPLRLRDDRSEVRASLHIAAADLDIEHASSALSGSFAEDAKAVVLVASLHDERSLLQLLARQLRVVARWTIGGSPDAGQCLEITHAYRGHE